MKRVFNIPPYHEEHVSQYLFISGLEFDKEPYYGRYGPEYYARYGGYKPEPYHIKFIIEVDKENKYKLERIKDFIPFKSFELIETYIKSFFPEGHALIRKEARAGRWNKDVHWAAYVFCNNKINRIEIGTHLKYITVKTIKDTLFKNGLQ